MSIKPPCSISSQYVTNNVDGFTALVRKMITGFRKRVLDSENSIIKSIVYSSYFILSSQLNCKWNKLAFSMC